MAPVSPQDPWVQVAEVVRLIRSGEAQTRPELADATRLGRNVITLRIQAAQELGLVEPSGDARSRGGRAAEVWQLRGDAGYLAIGIHGPTGFRVAIADLCLRVIAQRDVEWPIFTADPAETSERMAAEIEAMTPAELSGKLWGVGIGVLGPVNFTTGGNADPVAPSALGRWPRTFDVRGWFTKRMKAPVLVESVANLMALGASAAPGAPDDLIAIRMQLGVGSGIVSDGRLHRGADWIAGETNHVLVHPDSDRICICGKTGCLDAYAGAWAVAEDARRMLNQGRSTTLSRLDPEKLTVDDVVAAAESGDIASAEIILRAADALGRVLATVVTWFNPRRVVIGGNSLAASMLFQNAMRRTLNAQALAASVEHLEIKAGDPDRAEEVHGAFFMVREALLSPSHVAEWGPVGSPTKATALRKRITQI